VNHCSNGVAYGSATSTTVPYVPNRALSDVQKLSECTALLTCIRTSLNGGHTLLQRDKIKKKGEKKK
jgi:hypothetical protein